MDDPADGDELKRFADGLSVGAPSGLLNHWDGGQQRYPVPHDPVTGEPTDAGWRQLELVWGIRRPTD